MAIINLDDAYVLNETGAEVDKVTGLFTKDENTDAGEKAFAQLNIGTAGSNRNLLDNPWFTVNQRGAATVSSVGYHLDRWYSYNNYTVTANGITTTSAGNFDQTLESALKIALNGQTVTMSAKLADGTVYSATGTYYSAYGSTYSIGSGGGITFHITGDGKARYTFGNGLSIRAVKLELGSVSTLANDTPPDYVTELHKCEGYFRQVTPYTGIGTAISTVQVRVNIPYPKMNKAPTSGILNTPQVFINGSWASPTSYSVTDYNDGFIMFGVNISGITAGSSYMVKAQYLQISADL